MRRIFKVKVSRDRKNIKDGRTPFMINRALHSLFYFNPKLEVFRPLWVDGLSILANRTTKNKLVLLTIFDFKILHIKHLLSESLDPVMLCGRTQSKKASILLLA